MKNTKAQTHAPLSVSRAELRSHMHSVTSRMEQVWKLVQCCSSLLGADLLPAFSARLSNIPVSSAPASQAYSGLPWRGLQQSCYCRQCGLLDLKDCGKSQSHLAGEESWLCLCQLRGPNISGLIAVSIGKTRREFQILRAVERALPGDTDHSWQGAAWREAVGLLLLMACP